MNNIDKEKIYRDSLYYKHPIASFILCLLNPVPFFGFILWLYTRNVKFILTMSNATRNLFSFFLIFVVIFPVFFLGAIIILFLFLDSKYVLSSIVLSFFFLLIKSFAHFIYNYNNKILFVANPAELTVSYNKTLQY